MYRHLLGVLSLLLLPGCAGVSPTQLGQTVGTIAGAAIAPGIGAPFGALLGTLAGLVVEQEVDKVREQEERVELGRQLAQPGPPTAPSAAAPGGQLTRVWVDERFEQGRLMGGRFESRVIP